MSYTEQSVQNGSVGRLHGKVVLITGIGSGMGRVTAMLFACEGAIVVGCDLNAEAMEETVRQLNSVGYSIDALAPVDLSCRDAVSAWVEAA
ncbi:unnamed protein product, partial [marine sediment metagenome]